MRQGREPCQGSKKLAFRRRTGRRRPRRASTEHFAIGKLSCEPVQSSSCLTHGKERYSFWNTATSQSVLRLKISASQTLCSGPQVSRLKPELALLSMPVRPAGYRHGPAGRPSGGTPQVNCGDTGEGGRCGALGREREALYGYGERRCVSFTGLRSAFQERNALGMNPRQGG